MKLVEEELVMNLIKTVKNQQRLLEMIAHNHFEVLGRANVEAILEATRINLDDVEYCYRNRDKPNNIWTFLSQRYKKEKSDG